MKANVANTAKLLIGLTGKEAFSMLLGGYLQEAFKEPRTFTDAEIDRMMDDIGRRPVEMNECRAWWRTFDVMQHLIAECRRVAMDVTWRISVLFYSLQYHTARYEMKPSPKLEELLATLHPVVLYLQRLLMDYSRLRLLFEAFSAIHGQDITRMMGVEASILERHVDLYNRYVEHCSDSVTFETIRSLHKEGKAYDEGKAEHHENILPLLVLPPDDLPPGLPQTLIDAIHRHHADRTPETIMAAFDPPLCI